MLKPWGFAPERGDAVKFEDEDEDKTYAEAPYYSHVPEESQTSVYKGYKQDKIEMRGDRAEMSDFPPVSYTHLTLPTILRV